MAEINNTQQQNAEANPVNGATNLPQNEGNNTTVEKPQTTETNKDEGNEKVYSQKNLDDAQAKARGTAERETKRKILAELGLKDDEMDKLSAFKEAYQNSLSDEEKRQTELSNLQAENLRLTQDLEEKDYVIKALVEISGKNEEDVEKIVKMAKGLKTDDNTIDDAIKEVMSMIKVDDLVSEPTVTTTEINPNMPSSKPLQQPSTVVIDTTPNPFKSGQINLTEQGKLIKTNPELAKKLASEAGVKLPL